MRLLRKLLAAFVVLVAIAGCTPAPRLSNAPISSPANTPVDTGEVVVGVDTIAGGYNPHNFADQSAITTALSTLLLPSVFRPGPDGTPRLDRTLMTSAAVTRTEPYTVTYQIRADASWSDAAPIAAEDFVYLREQMTSQPGVVDSAGYRLISDITARDGGKVVEVVFGKPYPGWRTLFDNLLPAHILKDAPGGWTGALQTNFPATGGPFTVKTLDNDRGEVVLERNDRYWAGPAKLDRIVLRRTEQDTLVDALEQGHDQMALVRTDSVGADTIGELAPAVTTSTVARPSVTTVYLRPSQRLADLPVRQALVAMIDRDQLVTVGTGNGPAAQLRADAQVLAPTAPGYQPTRPGAVGFNTPAAQTLLTGAGYTRTSAGWARDDRPLELVIGAAEERPADVRIAKDVQRQLAAGGVVAEVAEMPGQELYERLYSTDTADAIDIAVTSRPAGGDPATTLATDFGCVTDATPPEPVNPVGYCDPAVQPTIDAALTGSLSVTEALTSVEPALWRAAVAIPLYQEADVLAVRGELSGVTAGAGFAGPFAGAAFWVRSTS
ncbi:ABC transporter family substrate-binding protein [Actinophytocola algeriensis]|uniref:ABC-type transport system substrate-binding protein n=1 Tax=Actinophytocola algeriensis TaxID=1768010 RepID=A0A7W7VJ35_9PSEU|nr:ABC transporter family substrate-binding protein [Actinophytocola algeriensis]MBB4911939.1 ABC-type transport system substrate-binding protein [Actinophytocola algeriensis]MBE1477569.1 ABC-type transport system substrate-binding protein [Actinophytocola algeriensis]